MRFPRIGGGEQGASGHGLGRVHDLPGDLDQPGVDRVGQRVRILPGGGPHPVQRAPVEPVVHGGEHDDPTARGRQRRQAPADRGAQSAVARKSGRWVGAAAELVHRDGRGELDQGEHVAVGDIEQAVGQVVGQCGPEVVPQHPVPGLGLQRPEPQAGQLGQELGPLRRGRVVGAEQDDHAQVVEPTGGERQRGQRPGVELVRRVHTAQRRSLRRGGGQQRVGGGAHRDRVDVGAQAERPVQRLRLPGGKPGQQVVQWPQQLVQTGERHLRFGDRAPGAQHPERPGPVGDLVEQCRLADTGPAHDDTRGSPAPGGLVEHPGQRGEFPVAPVHPKGVRGRRIPHGEHADSVTGRSP